ncbi:MAG: hypothetical protein IJJ74_04570 [Eubacterium sp.]|nr:hypothetical protein [Eubacterium sp.]
MISRIRKLRKQEEMLSSRMQIRMLQIITHREIVCYNIISRLSQSFPGLYSWYEQPDYVKIPIEEFDVNTLSFTYGDSMLTFAVNDGKEYRKKLYTYEEIL